MTEWAALIDVAPDPVTTGIGIVVALVLFVVAFVILLAGAFVLFLWLRKRRQRHGEMIRPDVSPRLDPVQVNQPNQP
jgi:Flp pilus assembly protein TadB